MTAQILAAVIFVGMFALIIMDKFERQYVTLGSAALVLVVVFGICMHSWDAIKNALNLGAIFRADFWYGASESASSGVNWSTIFFITGMMIMVEGLGKSGFFRWLCLSLAKLAHYHVVPLLLCFMAMSAFLAMFIDSITVVLFLATVTLELAQTMKFDPVPMILSEIFCAIVCPYLYPLRKKPNTYLVEGKAAPDTLPEGYKSNVEYGMDLAMKRVAEHKGIGEFFKSGAKNACSMWFGVLPSVMAIGTVALILANFTPIFEWLGIPFRPLLQLLQVPEADAVASTMIVGFTDMLTPAILIAESTSQMAKFIVAVVSVTQVLYLSEVGGLILGSKLPLNIWELFVIFLERTIISLLIVCPIAHLLF